MAARICHRSRAGARCRGRRRRRPRSVASHGATGPRSYHDRRRAITPFFPACRDYGVTLMPLGPFPTGTVAITLRPATSMTETLFAYVFVTSA